MMVYRLSLFTVFISTSYCCLCQSKGATFSCGLKYTYSDMEVWLQLTVHNLLQLMIPYCRRFIFYFCWSKSKRVSPIVVWNNIPFLGKKHLPLPSYMVSVQSFPLLRSHYPSCHLPKFDFHLPNRYRKGLANLMIEMPKWGLCFF